MNTDKNIRAYKLNKDDRGLSIVELVIVIAIMAILLGVLGLSINMLIGAEARQAAKKMDAQLNDIKTGAMTRASEYLILRYIDVDAEDKDTQKEMAELGIDKAGYYCEKHIATITNADNNSPDPSSGTGIKVDYGGVEYTRIGSKRVTITVNDTELSDAGTDGIYIEYDRRTGRLEDVRFVGITGSNKAPTFSEGSSEALNTITFESGFAHYEIEFDPETGRHTNK